MRHFLTIWPSYFGRKGPPPIVRWHTRDLRGSLFFKSRISHFRGQNRPFLPSNSIPFRKGLSEQTDAHFTMPSKTTYHLRFYHLTNLPSKNERTRHHFFAEKVRAKNSALRPGNEHRAASNNWEQNPIRTWNSSYRTSAISKRELGCIDHTPLVLSTSLSYFAAWISLNKPWVSVLNPLGPIFSMGLLIRARKRPSRRSYRVWTYVQLY